ncbi:MAG: amidohydrolase family protein [Pseudomonadota bacterium]
MLIRNVRTPDGTQNDLRLEGATIAAVQPDLVAHDGEETIDAAGALALPGLVNAHTHIDKTLWGCGWHAHSAGPTVRERIDNERAVLRDLTHDPQQQSARMVEQMLSLGTTAIRTHVDIVPEIGLAHLDGVLATCEQYADRVQFQVVAFPQLGVLSAPGTLTLLEAALEAGADVLGGLDPVGIDQDAKGQLDALFALAERFGVGIDLHLHDAGESGAQTIDLLAERSAALGMRGQIAVSHAFCLGSVDDARLEDLTAKLRDQDIAVMSHGPAGGISAPPVRWLHANGVRVFSGSDGVRDAWGPLNTPDMLERAYLVAYINGFRDDQGLELALHMATRGGADVMGLEGYGLSPGCRADLVLVEAENACEAVAAHPPRRFVIANGRVCRPN